MGNTLGSERLLQEVRRARRVGLDTNILIYFLTGQPPGYYPSVAGVMDMIDRGEVEGVVSVVTELELLVKPLREDDRSGLEKIEELMEVRHLTLWPLSRSVAQAAARLRAHRGLRLADAVIVATAIEAGCRLVLGNDALCARRVEEIPYLYLESFLQEGGHVSTL